MDPLRQHLISAIEGSQAHADFASAVKDFPEVHRGKKPAGASHSAWQLLEHLRLAQHDILEFSRDSTHQSPKWPEGYWPNEPTPPTPTAWDESIASFHKDRKAFLNLLSDPETDLYAPFPHGDGQTLLREALLILDHNSYHTGQLIMLRVELGLWA
jgi:uncharacterized damage-inducible protein DinB